LHETFKHVQIVCFGLSTSVLGKVINNCGDEVKSGRCFADGDRTSGIFTNFDCIFRAVSQQQLLRVLSWSASRLRQLKAEKERLGEGIEREMQPALDLTHVLESTSVERLTACLRDIFLGDDRTPEATSASSSTELW
jgi:hypothetical protein